MSYSSEEVSFPPIVVELSTVSCCLSIFGSFIIIWTYIWLPEIHNPARKLFTFLSFADCLSAVGYLISAVATYTHTFKDVCMIQSYITTFSSIVSFNLTIAIAILMFSTVVHQYDWEANMKFVHIANVISWSIPAIIVAIAGGIYQVLGKSFTEVHSTSGTGPWCWIDESKPNHVLWMFVAGKGWELLCYLLSTSLYVLLKIHLHLKHRNVGLRSIHPSIRDEDRNFMYVWLVLYVIRLWGTIRFFMNISKAGLQGTWHTMYHKELLYMQAFGDPAQGFCNFILFVLLDKTIRDKIAQLFCQVSACCRCCYKSNAVDDENARLAYLSSSRYEWAS